jgi:ankyrin repeat protein
MCITFFILKQPNIMNYKKIALYLLLLFTINKTHPMEWAKNNPIKSLCTTMIILSVYKAREVLTGIITELWLWSLYEKVSKSNYWKALARCFILIGKGKKLLYHAYKHNKELFIFLIQSGIDPNIIYPGEKPYLNKACFKENIELVKILLQCGADPNGDNQIDDFYQPPFCRIENWVYTRDVVKRKPLHCAFYKNNNKIIELLTQYNAKPFYSSWLWLLKCRDYRSFNHLLDYTMTQKNITLDNKKTCIYKYWLINQVLEQKDIIQNKIIPHVIYSKKFDEYIENFIQSYPLEQKKDRITLIQQINEHEPKILQFRYKHVNDFLPMNISDQEHLLITNATTS